MPYCTTTIELEKAARGEVIDPTVVRAIAQELVRARKKLSEIAEDDEVCLEYTKIDRRGY